MTRAALAVVLAITFAAPAFAQEKGRKVAFLVGVGDFRHDLTNLGVSPQKDATELGKVLKDGGFEVVVLTDKNATKAGIEEQFKKLMDGKGSLAKGDLLLVALCTHGFSLPPAAGQPDAPFLAAHDSKLNKPDTMVSLNGLIADGKSSGATVLYLIDACRETKADENRGQTRGIEPTQVTLPKGTAVLFSCGRGQVSHQHDKADGHGLFTFAVLTTLKGERGIKDEVSWNGLVVEVERAFKSVEFKSMIPEGKPQRPFSTSGELDFIDLMRVRGTGVSLEGDYQAYRKVVDSDELTATHLQRVAPARLTVWREQAQKGNSTGQFLLGVCFSHGAVVDKDEAEAARWYQKAANAGHSQAMAILGAMYKEGRGGLSKDEAEGTRWTRKAADAGEPTAMLTTGVQYALGAGVGKDEAEAARWYRKAAIGGHPQAMRLLGCAYEIGSGVGKDEAEAVRWYRKAADAGNPRAMTDLGAMYEEGRGGLLKDEVEAIRWHRKAAEAKEAKGLTRLGLAYFLGRGVAIDEGEASRWLRKAADAGDTEGMVYLATLYEGGKGVKEDIDEAVKWLKKAAALGNEAAKEELKRLGKD